VPQAKTINFGITLGTEVRLEPKNTSDISLTLEGLGYSKSFPSLMALLESSDSELTLVAPLLRYFKPESGFALTLKSQSPVGGGLGGSSSLLVGMIKCFSKWCGEKMTPAEIVRLACNLETRVLKKPAGTQDYISALEGGLNVIDYGDRGPEWTTHSGGGLNDRFFLVDTGKPHHSGLNNWEVIKQALDGDKKVLGALRGLADLSLEFEKSLLAEQWQELPELFEREFTHRVVSNHAGAALKICGAGGGGCVMVWTLPEDQKSLKSLVQKEGFTVLEAQFWARESAPHVGN
jgi:D-glycero-alpha-D-manno-heptose-7-phosphate kinase